MEITPGKHETVGRMPETDLVDDIVLRRVGHYLYLLGNPEPGASTEDTQVIAGRYFKDNLADQDPRSVNIALWMQT